MRKDEIKNWYIKVTRPEIHGNGQSCVYPWPGTHLVENELDDGEVGEIIQLELIQLTEREFKDLGEFEGW